MAASRRRFDNDALLDAALTCFVEDGYDATAMAALAAAAGTTKPTLYDRLGSKEDIYRQVVEREAAAVRSALERAYEDAATLAGDDAVRLATQPLFDLARERPHGFRILYGSIAGAPIGGLGDRVLGDVTTSVAQLLIRWTTAHDRTVLEEDAHLLATMCVGAVRNAVLAAADGPRRALDDAQRRASEFLSAALFNLPNRSEW